MVLDESQRYPCGCVARGYFKTRTDTGMSRPVCTCGLDGGNESVGRDKAPVQKNSQWQPQGERGTDVAIRPAAGETRRRCRAFKESRSPDRPGVREHNPARFPREAHLDRPTPGSRDLLLRN